MHPPPPNGLRLPLILGVAPLCLGVAVFLLWVATGATWVATAGLIAFYAGLTSVLAGITLLTVWFVKAVRSGERRWEASMMRIVLTAVILVINLPVAAVLISSAMRIDATYTVVIHNQSSAPIYSASITGGGVAVTAGTIMPGTRVTKRFHIVEDGALLFSGEQSGRKLATELDSYVTNNVGRHKELAVRADGAMVVRDTRSP